MAWTSDPLSEASLCGLVDIRARLNDAVESYEERIRHPENGRVPISKLSRAKAVLDYIRDRLDEYITMRKTTQMPFWHMWKGSWSTHTR